MEGKRNSKIWIVGLNPKGMLGSNDDRELEDTINYFDNEVHPYFKSFKKVSKRLYNLFGKDYGVAHTDLVKCFSNKFPPEGCKTKAKRIIIGNCRGYLKEQIKKYEPKILICNGAPVSCEMKEMFPKESQNDNIKTSYKVRINNSEMVIILSGFIGRIDNYAKRRLGLEIEKYMNKFEL